MGRRVAFGHMRPLLREQGASNINLDECNAALRPADVYVERWLVARKDSTGESESW